MALKIEIAADSKALAELALKHVDSIGQKALNDREHFIMSLAGGSTPEAFYRLWANRSLLDWKRMELLLGDERCVPPSNRDSNSLMVRTALLENLSRQPVFHPVLGVESDPEQAATEYGRLVKSLLNPEDALDLGLLGMGADGHTASLFPGSDALNEEKHRCLVTRSPGGDNRISLTLPVFRKARAILFLVAGKEKAEIVRDVVEGDLDPHRLPAQFLIRDALLEVTLLLDQAAASKLEKQS